MFLDFLDGGRESTIPGFDTVAGNPLFPFFIVAGLPLLLLHTLATLYQRKSRIPHNIRISVRMQVTQESFYITTTVPRQTPDPGVPQDLVPESSGFSRALL